LTQTPTIFISAVSSELGSYRQAAEAVLRARGYHTVHQEMFGLTDDTIERLLEDHLRACDAAVFLVGRRYGAEPSKPFERYGRVSYTQFEYHEATRLGLPTFLLVADEQNPPTPDVPEDQMRQPNYADLLALQNSYREQTIRDRDWRAFGNMDQLRSELGTMQFPWSPKRAGLDTSMGELAMRRDERRDQLAQAFDVPHDRLSCDLPDYAQVYLSEHWHEAERQAVDTAEQLATQEPAEPKPVLCAYWLAGLSAARQSRLRAALEHLNDAGPWVEQAGSPRLDFRVASAKGQVLCQLRRYEQAYKVLAEAVPKGGQLFEATDASLLRAKSNLAVTLSMTGRPAEAEPILKEVFKIRRRQLGPEHTRTIEVSMNLLSALTLQGRNEEAEDGFVELRLLCKNVLGPYHRTTLHLTVELAVCYAQQALHDEAIAEYQTGLAGCERVYGEEGERTARVLNDLAWVLHEAGRNEEAESYAARAVKVLKAMGRKHIGALNARHTYATIKAALGETELACRELKTLIRDQSSVLGKAHEDTLTSQCDRAELLIGDGELKEAKVELEAARQGGQALSDSHPLLQRISTLNGQLDRSTPDNLSGQANKMSL
jgi:tetratricopeptide (TPR) repeat protein